MVYNLYIHQNVWINRNITAPSDTSDPPSTVCRACLRSPRHGGTHNYSSRSLHTSIRIGFYISLSNCTHRSWWCLPRQAGFGAAGCSCRGWRWRRGSRRRAARNWWWSGRTEADTGQHGVFRTLHLAHLDTARIAPMKDRASESPPVWQLCSFFPEQWVIIHKNEEFSQALHITVS